MRNLKFILSALAILLAGALAAGYAARTVVAPRTGEAVSAGVVPIPSVLGQTADEVLFYPWPLYETVTFEPPSSLFELEGEEQAVQEMADSFSHRFFAPLSLFGVELDELAAFKNTQYAFISRTQSALTFLKDFPVQAGDGMPLAFSFAYSDWDPFSISYLVRPQNRETITEEQREQALERVRADLWELLTSWELLAAVVNSNAEWDDALFVEVQSSYIMLSGEAAPIDNGMAALLAGYYTLSQERSLDASPLSFIWESLRMIFDLYGFSVETPLDDVLAALDETGTQVQLVSTPDQVIALFTCGTTMVGVYYDVQLGRYSGIGLSG